MTELELHAAGFAVRHDGHVDDVVRARFQAFVRARDGQASPDELAAALDEASARYRSEDALHVCAAAPCSNGRVLASDAIPIRRTGCQGFCKHKPLVALRAGGGRELVGRATTPRDHEAVVAFARAAIRDRSLLVPERGPIEPLRIDVEHGGEAPAAHLRRVHFLTHRFRGRGRYVDGSYAFTKEVVGTYEAGGRFLSLRMEAHYPTSDHGTDVHRALVVVGATELGALVGRAFTDGGDIHDYAITCANDELAFEDRSPEHGMRCKAVRKRLRPTATGYEEQLEIDRGDGFAPFYAIAMDRVARTVLGADV